MKLSHVSWPLVSAFAAEAAEKVCLIPTGSLEQHGPHLPLFTDSLIVTAVAEEAENRLPDQVLLLPTVWLGASAHHLGFAGSLTASFDSYLQTLKALFASLAHHGFCKFFVLNGHGGNTDPNGLAVRQWRLDNPLHILGHGGYFEFTDPSVWTQMEGRFKTIRHACEAETSLMLHLHPDLVDMSRAGDDGLQPEVAVPGAPWTFDELTETGVLGQASLGRAELGAAIFESSVEGLVKMLEAMASGIVLVGEE